MCGCSHGDYLIASACTKAAANLHASVLHGVCVACPLHCVVGTPHTQLCSLAQRHDCCCCRCLSHTTLAPKACKSARHQQQGGQSWACSAPVRGLTGCQCAWALAQTFAEHGGAASTSHLAQKLATHQELWRFAHLHGIVSQMTWRQLLQLHFSCHGCFQTQFAFTGMHTEPCAGLGSCSRSRPALFWRTTSALGRGISMFCGVIQGAHQHDTISRALPSPCQQPGHS